jgi:hypothetical protein
MHEPFSEPIQVEKRLRSRRLFGQFALPDGSTHAAWVELTHQEREPSPISCQLRHPTTLPERFVVPHGDERELRLTLEFPFAGTLRLHQIGGGRYQSREASFALGAYDLIDAEPAIPEGSRIHFMAAPTSRGFLVPAWNRLVNWDGTIEKLGDDWPPITWPYGGSEYSLRMAHESRNAAAGSARGLLLTQQPLISCQFDQAEAADFTALLDRIAASLELPFVLFSFLSRQTIELFELAIHVRTPDGKLIESHRRTDASPPAGNVGDERPQFDDRQLAQGSFADMLRVLEGCDAQADIVRSIRYLLGSYRHDTVDTKFLLAVAALETFVNFLETAEPTVDNSGIDWKVLNRALLRVLRCYGRRRQLDTKVLQRLQSKVADLRKPSFTAKTLHHVQRLAVDTSGLWLNYRSAADEFAAGVAGAYRTRSALVHNTSIEDLGRLISDLARVQCLLERMIMRLLGDYRPEISQGLVYARYRAARSESGL